MCTKILTHTCIQACGRGDWSSGRGGGLSPTLLLAMLSISTLGNTQDGTQHHMLSDTLEGPAGRHQACHSRSDCGAAGEEAQIPKAYYTEYGEGRTCKALQFRVNFICHFTIYTWVNLAVFILDFFQEFIRSKHLIMPPFSLFIFM